MTYLAGGLGDAASDFADAKQRWEARRGIPYTGNALLASDLDAEDGILTAIANGDITATVQGLGHSDPAVRSIAQNYMQRYFDYSPQQAIGLAVNGVISPDLFKQFAGHALNEDPAWRYQRENDVAGAIFPILGAGSGSRSGTAGNWSVGFEFTGHNIYDLDFDFAALKDAAQRFADAHKASITPPTEEAVATATAQTDTPFVPSGTPSGWRWNGTDGWWGPDGLFYAGKETSTPWFGGTTGVKVDTFTAQPKSGGSTTPPAVVLPVDTGWGGDTGSDALPPVSDGPGAEFVPNGTITDTDQPAGTTSAPQTAGLGGSMPLLLGAGLVVGLLLMKKKGR